MSTTLHNTEPTEPTEITAELLFGPLPINMDQLSRLFLAAKSAGESGHTLGEIKGLSASELNVLYERSIVLCGEEKWSDAVVIALQLALHEPRNARFLFLSGICLQHMQEFKAAASMFGLCLIDQEEPISVFRMAECLAAAGAFEPARESFDACHELCRGRYEFRDLQDACADALVKLTRH